MLDPAPGRFRDNGTRPIGPAVWTSVQVNGITFNVQVYLDQEFIGRAIREAARLDGPATYEVSQGGVTLRYTRTASLVGGKVVA